VGIIGMSWNGHAGYTCHVSAQSPYAAYSMVEMDAAGLASKDCKERIKIAMVWSPSSDVTMGTYSQSCYVPLRYIAKNVSLFAKSK
jgi:hypothetical protein